MRIVITGASGLLGINLLLEAAPHHSIIGVVHHNLLQNPSVKMIEADLAEKESIFRILDKIRPDYVINCAALAEVDLCEKDHDLAFMLNVDVPRRLAQATRILGVRLIHISTDAVFDGCRGNYTEADLPNPINFYGRTKLAGENAVFEENSEAVVARVNFFGWSLSGRRSLAEWFFHNLSANHQIKGFLDVHFCPLLVNDLARILLKIIEGRLTGLFHAVSSTCTSKYEFGLSIAREFGFNEDLISPVSVKDAALQAGRSTNLTMSSEKLRGALNQELPTWFQGIKGFFDLYKKGYPQLLKSMAYLP